MACDDGSSERVDDASSSLTDELNESDDDEDDAAAAAAADDDEDVDNASETFMLRFLSDRVYSVIKFLDFARLFDNSFISLMFLFCF